ncbi:hypothetical protein [Moorena sp. SIO3H5]|uniref:hypothetical protein n=1 Tax=Moorena sp. SIO3H5 TaxID=2607834 RepID=UPI0013B77646|nr:hypothetical protein [Moorena sp. SIO3H5]NEO71002.1 hypothetical protein [Moorena sp. SIO3H5]
MKVKNTLIAAATAMVFAFASGLNAQEPVTGDINTASEFITSAIQALASNKQIMNECGKDLIIEDMTSVTQDLPNIEAYPTLGEIQYRISFTPGANTNPSYCAGSFKSRMKLKFNGRYLNPRGAELLSTPNTYEFRLMVPGQENSEL